MVVTDEQVKGSPPDHTLVSFLLQDSRLIHFNLIHHTILLLALPRQQQREVSVIIRDIVLRWRLTRRVGGSTVRR
jgi:hypothetical protein